jgi:UDP:flavonoid glycosyltransferase YjiC (YdhE family)
VVRRGRPHRTGPPRRSLRGVRILAACSLGGAGHLNPLVPFLAAARRDGHDVLVVGPPALAAMVAGAGFPFRAGGEPPESAVAPIRDRLPIAPPDEAAILGNRDLFGRLATDTMLPGMADACREWSPHLLLRDPCEYASAVVARRLGIPMAQVAISLASVEAGSIATAAPALEAHDGGLVDALRAAPYLTRFPTSVDPSPFPATTRYRDVAPPRRGPLPDWWEGSHAPLVWITFGTVLGFMTGAPAVYRTALTAVGGLPVRGLLTTGHRLDHAALGRIPANAQVEAWVDLVDAVADAQVVVCHGGSGTTLGALAAGVPLVVLPLFADQRENARRVAETGAGVVVVPDAGGRAGALVGPGDAERIADGVRAVLATPSHRLAAEAVGAEMAASPTVDGVLGELLAGI